MNFVPARFRLHSFSSVSMHIVVSFNYRQAIATTSKFKSEKVHLVPLRWFKDFSPYLLGFRALVINHPFTFHPL